MVKPAKNQITIKKECEFYLKKEPFEEHIFNRENVEVLHSASVVFSESVESVESVKAQNKKLKVELQSAKKNHQREISEYKQKIAIYSRENKSMAARINQLMKCKNENHNNESLKIEKEIYQNNVADTAMDDDVYEVEDIVSHKIEYGKELYLVRWKGFDSKDDTWVRKDNLKCPKLLKTYGYRK